MQDVLNVMLMLSTLAALLFCEAWRRAIRREGWALNRAQRYLDDATAAEGRLAGVLDGTFSVGDDAAQREIERLRAGVEALRQMVDQTDPDDAIGVALTRAGLTGHEAD